LREKINDVIFTMMCKINFIHFKGMVIIHFKESIFDQS